MIRASKMRKLIFFIFLLIFDATTMKKSLVVGLSPAMHQTVKSAMQISMEHPINYKRACQAWEDVLLGEESVTLPPQIASLAFSFYGSALASCGKDKRECQLHRFRCQLAHR